MSLVLCLQAKTSLDVQSDDKMLVQNISMESDKERTVFEFTQNPTKYKTGAPPCCVGVRESGQVFSHKRKGV